MLSMGSVLCQSPASYSRNHIAIENCAAWLSLDQTPNVRLKLALCPTPFAKET